MVFRHLISFTGAVRVLEMQGQKKVIERQNNIQTGDMIPF